MRLWRLARRPFASLDGRGAERYGGRWNPPGQPIVYTAAEASLAVLEVRVHPDLPFELLPDDCVLVEIESNNASMEAGPILTDADECHAFGDRWLRQQRSALLSVPSAIVSYSKNVLINPRHPEADRVQIERLHEWRFDSRLF